MKYLNKIVLSFLLIATTVSCSQQGKQPSDITSYTKGQVRQYFESQLTSANSAFKFSQNNDVYEGFIFENKLRENYVLLVVKNGNTHNPVLFLDNYGYMNILENRYTYQNDDSLDIKALAEIDGKKNLLPFELGFQEIIQIKKSQKFKTYDEFVSQFVTKPSTLAVNKKSTSENIGFYLESAGYLAAYSPALILGAPFIALDMLTSGQEDKVEENAHNLSLKFTKVDLFSNKQKLINTLGNPDVIIKSKRSGYEIWEYPQPIEMYNMNPVLSNKNKKYYGFKNGKVVWSLLNGYALYEYFNKTLPCRKSPVILYANQCMTDGYDYIHENRTDTETGNYKILFLN